MTDSPNVRVYWTDAEKRFLAEGRTDEAFWARFGTLRSAAALRRQRQLLGAPSPSDLAAAQMLAQVETDEPEFDATRLPAEELAAFAAQISGIGDDLTDHQVLEIFKHAQAINDIVSDMAPSTSTASRSFDEDLPIGVAFTGDWHCGGGGVELERLRSDMQRIGATDGLYAIGMGDYVDGVSIHSKAVSALYDPSAIGDRGLQNDYARIVAEPVRGKWLAIADGNHDAWSERHASIGCTKDFAKQLGAPYFHQGGGTVFVTVGGTRYTIAVRHNASGNSRLNTTNAQRRMFDEWPEWSNCDVICLAHYHFNDMHQATRKGGSCSYLRSGTYKLRDAYSANNGYTPEWGIPVVVLMPGERRVVPFRGDRFDEALRFLASERAYYLERRAA